MCSLKYLSMESNDDKQNYYNSQTGFKQRNVIRRIRVCVCVCVCYTVMCIQNPEFILVLLFTNNYIIFHANNHKPTCAASCIYTKIFAKSWLIWFWELAGYICGPKDRKQCGQNWTWSHELKVQSQVQFLLQENSTLLLRPFNWLKQACPQFLEYYVA